MASLRVCPATGCPILIPRTARYCPTHMAEHEARRGTAEQRGYGREHRRLRAAYARRMAAGERFTCRHCGLTVTAPWDLGHNDERTAWTGPEHATCGRRDGGRRSH